VVAVLAIGKENETRRRRKEGELLWS